MKSLYIYLPLFALLTSGCWSNQKTASETVAVPVQTTESVQTEKNKSVPTPVVQKQSVTSNTVPVSPEKELKKPLETAVKTPAEPPRQIQEKKLSPPPHNSRSPEKFRRGPGLWKAFSTLSPEEQRELMKIQRQDPEKFKQLMQAKIEVIYQQEQIRRQKQNELVQKYHAEKDPAVREKIKAELRKKINDDFQKRLAANRRDLENNKKRIARMEVELQKREKKRDKIVEAILLNRLSDNPRPMPDKRRK